METLTRRSNFSPVRPPAQSVDFLLLATSDEKQKRKVSLRKHFISSKREKAGVKNKTTTCDRWLMLRNFLWTVKQFRGENEIFVESKIVKNLNVKPNRFHWRHMLLFWFQTQWTISISATNRTLNDVNGLELTEENKTWFIVD